MDLLAFYGCLRNCLDFIIIISIIISTIIIIIIIIIFIKSASNNLKVNRLEIIANGTRCVVTIIRYPAQGQQPGRISDTVQTFSEILLEAIFSAVWRGGKGRFTAHTRNRGKSLSSFGALLAC